MEKQILSVQETRFRDKDSGQEKQMWKIYMADSTGAVGYIYSMKEYTTGEIVTLDITVNRDGRFTAKILG